MAANWLINTQPGAKEFVSIMAQVDAMGVACILMSKT